MQKGNAHIRGLGIGLMMALAVITAPGSFAQSPDRSSEGDWHLSDSTDNNTGERSVYAMNLYLKDGVFVQLYMRCTDARPTFFVDWDEVTFPDKAVLTIGSVGSGQDEEPYVFDKSTDIVESGLRASPQTSAKIVAAIGEAKQANFTAHLSSGPRAVTIDVAGTQRAWSRVVRHCPVRIVPVPPL